MLLKSRLRNYLARRLMVPEIPSALERLLAAGFRPKLIFDVGAYQGDFAKECFRIWPQSQVACFEALEHKIIILQQLTSVYPKLQVFPGLLGATKKENVPLHESETASSVLSEHIQQDFPVNRYPMRTIDQIVDEHFQGEAPDLLKLDVQGYELEVLKGSRKSLNQVKAILTEVSLIDIHVNVPLLSELIAWFAERDWVAYDICGLTRRPLDKALWQADFIFVPISSNLRTDKRWKN
jgi:FkbM family methyltransferase